jgi:hypothetical protein
MQWCQHLWFTVLLLRHCSLPMISRSFHLAASPILDRMSASRPKTFLPLCLSQRPTAKCSGSTLFLLILPGRTSKLNVKLSWSCSSPYQWHSRTPSSSTLCILLPCFPSLQHWPGEQLLQNDQVKRYTTSLWQEAVHVASTMVPASFLQTQSPNWTLESHLTSTLWSVSSRSLCSRPPLYSVKS